ncbi:MAG: sortase [Candidatus Daviesbacteria bacterium]|nr:sortase [Candidatus Daviesbacteria bacterium]
MKLNFSLPHYHKVFLVRFLSYLFILIGILTVILIVEPVSIEEIKFDVGELSGRKAVLPKVITSQGIETPQPTPVADKQSGFGDIFGEAQKTIIPKSTDFGIVIEKIDANAKIIKDVNPNNETEYLKALSEGIAHAKGTSLPGEVGNMYLFSHSVNAPWDVVRFNAVFYLLNKLSVGDRVVIFYQGKRFDYIIFDKTVAKATDTNFLVQNYETPVLTMQTCDPPGTTINRLIVRARLEGDKPFSN